MSRRGLPFDPGVELLDLPLRAPEPAAAQPARRSRPARRTRHDAEWSAPQPDEASPPFLRPKTRTRVRRVRRGAARMLLAVQALGAVLVALAGVWTGYTKLMSSERLKVARVEVRGSHFLSEGEVRELIGPAVGQNILTLDIEALKARLRTSPWVADAVVGRSLPDALRVEVRERVPLALAEVERLYLMDADGGLIDIYGPRTAAFELPIVRGLKGLEGEARRQRAQRAAALLRDLEELGSEVSELHVDSAGDIRLVLRGAGEVLLLAEPPYRHRVLTFLGLRSELRQRAPDAESFDLRFRGRIYARRAEASAGPAAGADRR
jgi:cell division protein FtsQ